ncbi:MAG: DUF4377 domain-containing protein [Candidatus Poribacteria bacterium]|nr:DUF4377 domain-containing protein [Candidatus Poribacteria bacterium]
MRIAAILGLALLMACSELAEIYEEFGDQKQDDIHEAHTEILMIGPYTMTCYGPFERDCLMEYNEEAGRWHFFYDGIEGFDFEPGYIYTLEVRLEDRGTEIQDVGRYSYHLIKLLDKVKAPDDFDYARNEKPDFSNLESSD